MQQLSLWLRCRSADDSWVLLSCIGSVGSLGTLAINAKAASVTTRPSPLSPPFPEPSVDADSRSYERVQISCRIPFRQLILDDVRETIVEASISEEEFQSLSAARVRKSME